MKKCCDNKITKLPKKILLITVEALIGTLVLRYIGRLLQVLGCSLTAPLISVLLFVLVLSVIYILFRIFKITFNKCRIVCNSGSSSCSSSSSSSSNSFYSKSSCSSSLKSDFYTS